MPAGLGEQFRGRDLGIGCPPLNLLLYLMFSDLFCSTLLAGNLIENSIQPLEAPRTAIVASTSVPSLALGLLQVY